MAIESNTTNQTAARKSLPTAGEETLREALRGIAKGDTSYLTRGFLEQVSMELSKGITVVEFAMTQAARQPLSAEDDQCTALCIIDDYVRNAKVWLDRLTGELIQVENARSASREKGSGAIATNLAHLFADFDSAQASLAAINAEEGEADGEAVQDVIAQRDKAVRQIFAIPSVTHRHLVRKFEIAETMARDADDAIPEKNAFPEIIANLKLDVMRLHGR